MRRLTPLQSLVLAPLGLHAVMLLVSAAEADAPPVALVCTYLAVLWTVVLTRPSLRFAPAVLAAVWPAALLAATNLYWRLGLYSPVGPSADLAARGGLGFLPALAVHLLGLAVFAAAVWLLYPWLAAE